jgi:hypothetical protein
MSTLFALVPPATILSSQDEVAAFLAANVGLTREQLFQALDVGMAEAGLVTKHSAAASFGTRLWDGTLTSLRDQLCLNGWTVERPGNLEVVRRADSLLQLTPSLGSRDTGTTDAGSPTWEHVRGVSTERAVSDNQGSFSDLIPNEASLRPIQTWWLLYTVVESEGQKRLRAELSLPVVVTGGIPQWKYRLLLGERPFGVTNIASIPEAAPEPQVSIARR